ncbi:hypothetical protein [Allohahella sp. A8]|uniref:hypothetical protein n=1 Tax=Allohahella sp. A8 TaxID=3141461 RepID=UPI003A80E1E4
MTSLSSVGAAGASFAFNPSAAAGLPPSAQQLIRDFTNPSTGSLDTRGLADRMAELADGNQELAESLFGDVESALKMGRDWQFPLAHLREDFDIALGGGQTVEPLFGDLLDAHKEKTAEQRAALQTLLEENPGLEQKLEKDPHWQLLKLESTNADKTLLVGIGSQSTGSGQALMTRLFQAIGIGTSGASPMGLVKMTAGLVGDDINGRIGSEAMGEAAVDPFDLIQNGTELIKRSFGEREAAADTLLEYAQLQAEFPSGEQLDTARLERAKFAAEVLDLQSMAVDPDELVKFASDTANAAGGIDRVIDEDYSDFTFDTRDRHFHNGSLDRESYYDQASAGIAVWEQEGGNWTQLANEAIRHSEAVERYISRSPALNSALVEGKVVLAEVAAASDSGAISPELSEKVSKVNENLRELMAPLQEDLRQLQKIKAICDAYR